MSLTTASSLLVPLAGLASAPLLSRALGADGRGEVAAALAPNLLIVTVATLGLPEAMTYFAARKVSMSTRSLLSFATSTLALGAIAIAATFALAGPLSGEDPTLEGLIRLGALLAPPALLLGLLRGYARGVQRWGLVALEQALGAIGRAVALGLLLVFGHLTVLTALLVTILVPSLACAAYIPFFLKLVRRRTSQPRTGNDPSSPWTAEWKTVTMYGARTWVGSIASMLGARLSQILVVPLSDARQLGLYVVAITVADIPFLLAAGIRDVVFGMGSRDQDIPRLAQISRLISTTTLALNLILVVSLPFWLSFVFGSDFAASMWPAVVLMIASTVSAPGLLAASVLSACGFPGLRSAIITGGLIVGVLFLVLLTPPLGALGAAAGTLLATTATSTATIVATSLKTNTRLREWFVPNQGDLQVARALLARLWRSRQPGARA